MESFLIPQFVTLAARRAEDVGKKFLIVAYLLADLGVVDVKLNPLGHPSRIHSGPRRLKALGEIGPLALPQRADNP